MEAVTRIPTKDSVTGNTIHEIRGQIEVLLQFVHQAAQDGLQLYNVERRVFDEVLEEDMPQTDR